MQCYMTREKNIIWCNEIFMSQRSDIKWISKSTLVRNWGQYIFSVKIFNSRKGHNYKNISLERQEYESVDNTRLT